MDNSLKRANAALSLCKGLSTSAVEKLSELNPKGFFKTYMQLTYWRKVKEEKPIDGEWVLHAGIHGNGVVIFPGTFKDDGSDTDEGILIKNAAKYGLPDGYFADYWRPMTFDIALLKEAYGNRWPYKQPEGTDEAMNGRR